MQMPIYMDGGGGCRLCYTLIHAVFIGLPHNSRVATLLGGSNDAGSDSINGVTPRVRVRIRRSYMSVPQAVRAWERYTRSTPAPPGGPGDIPDFSAWMYNPKGFHQIQLFSFQSWVTLLRSMPLGTSTTCTKVSTVSGRETCVDRRRVSYGSMVTGQTTRN